jgi:hypothetical protein
MTRAEVSAAVWSLDRRNPLLRPPFPSPILADPTFLPPASTPDGRWHLFAHSLFGIHHHVSPDGVVWRRRERLCGNALRAFLYQEDGRYYLLYERCRLMLSIRRSGWFSQIELRISPDLERWSPPSVLLRPTLAWHAEPGRGAAVGNPCVLRVNGRYRLYYSAGLVRLADCGFDEPRYIGIAEADALAAPFTPHPRPLLSPDPDDPFANLGAGSLKVLAVEDGFVGFQNGIYWDARAGHSGSAVRLLSSRDGLGFAPAGEPFLRPGSGWMRSHVYAVDVRRVGDALHLYFNARSGWHWLTGREAIGRATAALGSGPAEACRRAARA